MRWFFVSRKLPARPGVQFLEEQKMAPRVRSRDMNDLLLSSAATARAYLITREEMMDNTCTAAVSTNGTSVETVTEDSATVRCTVVARAIVTKTIMQVSHATAVQAVIKYISCHS